MLKLSRNGAVGFIDWLDAACRKPFIDDERTDDREEERWQNDETK
jgi:hypothetical protein